MATRTIDLAWTLALALGVHALIGFTPFPNVDDYAYAVLADAARDPSLFSRDDQLALFANHAHAYTAIYRLADATVGLGAGFWLAVVALGAGCVTALRAIHRAMDVPAEALLIALGLGVLGAFGGVGRGAYGGLIGDSFHHQGVALCFSLWALAAFLHGRGLVAGLLLGLAAWAQPATAALASAALAGAALPAGREGFSRLARAAGASAAVAAPLILSLATGAGGQTSGDLIDAAYRFRAPGHYDVPPVELMKIWAFAAAGLLAAAAMHQRGHRTARALFGALAALAATQLVTTVVYAGGVFEWVPLFILDTTRITPLLFALAGLAVGALAADLIRTQTLKSLDTAALALAALAFVLNASLIGLLAMALGAALLWRPSGPAQTALAGAALALFGVFALVRPGLSVLPENERPVLAWAEARTPQEALFIVPPDMYWFRLHARRAVYADFKLFSVAQPDQAALTRDRLAVLAPEGAALETSRGWHGVRAWADTLAETTSCTRIATLLERTGADYYVHRRETYDGAERFPAPDCGADTAQLYADDRYTVYGRAMLTADIAD